MGFSDFYLQHTEPSWCCLVGCERDTDLEQGLPLLNLVEIRAEGRVPPILGHYARYLQNL